MKGLLKESRNFLLREALADKPSLIDVSPREGRDFLQFAADKFAELIRRDIPNYKSLDMEAVISEIMPQVLRSDFEAAKEQFGGFYDLLDELMPLVKDRLDLNESVRRSRNSRNLYEAPDISQYEIVHDPIVKPREAEDALYRLYKVMIDSMNAPDIKDESDAKRAAQGFEYVITTDVDGSGRVVDIYYNPNMPGKMEAYKAVRRVQTETSDVVVGNVAGPTSRRTASSILNKMRFVGIIVDDKIYYSTHTNDRVEVRSGGETYFVDGGRVNPTYNTAAIIFTVKDGTIVPKQKRRRGNLNESKLNESVQAKASLKQRGENYTVIVRDDGRVVATNPSGAVLSVGNIVQDVGMRMGNQEQRQYAKSLAQQANTSQELADLFNKDKNITGDRWQSE